MILVTSFLLGFKLMAQVAFTLIGAFFALLILIAMMSAFAVNAIHIRA